MDLVTALDSIAFLFCVGSTIFLYKTQRLTKNKYFWPIIAALVYASCLRLLYVLIDFNINIGITKADGQVLFLGFYVLSFVGFAGIYYGFKKFLTKPK